MGGQPSAPPPTTGGGSVDAEDFSAELRDSDPTIRLFAVKQLAQSKDAKAVEYLVEACSDEDNRVRVKAIDSLGTMRASGATTSLVQMLYLRESKPWLKQRVLVALGKIGDSRAARPIGDLMTRESDRRTVGTAIFALGAIGDPASIDRLEKISAENEDPDLKRLANDAVAKIKKRQINPEIVIEALRPDPNEVQRPASASVGNPLAY
jgi:HEAT repeat protein